MTGPKRFGAELQTPIDDSFRFVERAVAAGVDARVDLWEGMVHGFLGGVGRWQPPRRRSI
jgi:hypothetical protein